MKKEIFINESMGETRIAILEEDRLVEVYVEKQGQQRMVSNIYKGKVENVIPGMQAAFVDIGYGINAFLPFSEIHNGEFLLADVDREDTKPNNKKRVDNGNIEVDLHTGQEIFVQIIKEPFASKGPRVTTEIAIPGRLLVLVPNVNYIGISKKLWDKYERRRLKKIANKLRKKDFENSIIDLICFQIKSQYPNINEKKTLLPVIYASVSGITITMATKKLRRKGYEIYSNKKILDTIGNFDQGMIEEFAMQTRKVIFKVAKRFGFCKRKTIVSIDFHDKPFYGNKNISEIVGTKKKLGTNFAYSYITICICEEGIRFNLGLTAE